MNTELAVEIEQLVRELLRSTRTKGAERRLHCAFTLLVSEVGLVMRSQDRSRNGEIHALLSKLRVRASELLESNQMIENVQALESEVKYFTAAAGR